MRTRSWTAPSSTGSTSSTPPTPTAAVAGPRRSSAAGSPRATGGGTRWCSPPRSTAGGDPWPNTSRLSARHIREACDASLRRLQTDHLDLYQMHHVDRDTPWEEIWQAMDLLVAQGKVIYVGLHNFAGWHIAKANEHAARRGSLGLVSEQSLYNLNARMVELEVLPACRRLRPRGHRLEPARRRAARRRPGRGRPGAPVPASACRRPSRPTDKLEPWEKLCAEMGTPPATVALAWLLANPAVTAPIVGPRTLEQLDGAMGALEVELSEEVLAELDRIFPGPGGAAPEAYAW